MLAKELGPRNIRVNSINLGMIETEGVHAAGFIGSDFQKMVEAQSPLGRVGQPEDIAPTAVYLASSDSKYMTGETLVVSGGLRCGVVAERVRNCALKTVRVRRRRHRHRIYGLRSIAGASNSAYSLGQPSYSAGLPEDFHT